MAIPAVGPCVGRRDDLVLSDLQEIHRRVRLGIHIVPRLHCLLELSPDLQREACAVLEVVVHEPEDWMLVALRVDGVALTLDPTKMILCELVIDDLRQSVMVVFHLDWVLTIFDRREAKSERARFVVAVVVEQHRV